LKILMAPLGYGYQRINSTLSYVLILVEIGKRFDAFKYTKISVYPMF